MRRQAMHHDRALASILQQRVIPLETLEVAPALHGFLLAAHRGPGVGVNNVRVLHRLGGIIGYCADFFIAQPLHEIFLRLVAFWTREPKFETRERRRLNPALREVEAITNECDAHLPEIAPEA